MMILRILIIVALIKTSYSQEHCITIGKNNLIYCNITEFWAPRNWVTNAGFNAIVYSPFFFSLAVNLITIGWFWRYFVSGYSVFNGKIDVIDPKADIGGLSQKIVGIILSKKTALKFGFIVYWLISPTVLILYDSIDVGMDALYFYKLETLDRSLLDPRIMRNVHVNNVIYAFAIIGALKSILIAYVMRWLCRILGKTVKKLRIVKDENKEILEKGKDHRLRVADPTIANIMIVFEDAVELYFEFNYVDRYVTEGGANWLVLTKSTLLALFAAYLLFSQLSSLTDQYKRAKANNKIKPRFVLFLLLTSGSTLVALVNTLRAWYCWEQQYSGEIREGCLTVKISENGGSLVQQPLDPQW